MDGLENELNYTVAAKRCARDSSGKPTASSDSYRTKRGRATYSPTIVVVPKK